MGLPFALGIFKQPYVAAASAIHDALFKNVADVHLRRVSSRRGRQSFDRFCNILFPYARKILLIVFTIMVENGTSNRFGSCRYTVRTRMQLQVTQCTHEYAAPSEGLDVTHYVRFNINKLREQKKKKNEWIYYYIGPSDVNLRI